MRHPKLQGNQLPEIHAVDLFQSKGYYRKYRRGTKNDVYWLPHYDWLEEALELIREHEVTFIPYACQQTSAKKGAGAFLEPIESLDNSFFAESIYTRKSSKIESLANNSYLYTLPVLLISIENCLRLLNQMSEVICDDHEMSKGFSVTQSINWLRQRGHYTHITAPRFVLQAD